MFLNICTSKPNKHTAEKLFKVVIKLLDNNFTFQINDVIKH